MKALIEIATRRTERVFLVGAELKSRSSWDLQDSLDELSELAAKARDRKLQMSEMQGGTFTITNLGGIGGTSFTPIVNYPEVAILGMTRSQKQLQLIDGEVTERLMLPLSLSYDHRVINGADAARFVVKLANMLSDAFRLLIEC